MKSKRPQGATTAHRRGEIARDVYAYVRRSAERRGVDPFSITTVQEFRVRVGMLARRIEERERGAPLSPRPGPADIEAMARRQLAAAGSL